MAKFYSIFAWTQNSKDKKSLKFKCDIRTIRKTCLSFTSNSPGRDPFFYKNGGITKNKNYYVDSFPAVIDCEKNFFFIDL